jgi:hypothetical protein
MTYKSDCTNSILPRSIITRRTVLQGAGAALIATGVPAAAAEPVSFGTLVVRGGEFSDTAKKLARSEIEMQGYMAPPLKPDVTFFVLTQLAAEFCPFCDSEESWPDDIVLVLMRRRTSALKYDQLIKVRGILELGAQTDPATGFVSLVRLVDAQYRLA